MAVSVERSNPVSNPRELLPDERVILERLQHFPQLNLQAIGVLSNLFRASTSVRRYMEAGVLASDRLSWTSFTTLWVLWIWGTMEVRELAERVGISRPTTTGVVATLKRRDCVRSRRGSEDGRSVFVSLTPKGRRLIERLFPLFNKHESTISSHLDSQEQDTLARLLRVVLRTTEAARQEMSEPEEAGRDLIQG